MSSSNDYDLPYESAVSLQEDLRHRISATVLDRAALLTSDTVAIFPYSGSEPLESEYCKRIGELIVQLSLVPRGSSVRFEDDHQRPRSVPLLRLEEPRRNPDLRGRAELDRDRLGGCGSGGLLHRSIPFPRPNRVSAAGADHADVLADLAGGRYLP